MSVTLSPASPQKLHAAATSGNGGILVLHGQCQNVTIDFESAGTTSGGTLVIEEAYYDPNGPVSAATWSQLGSDVAASGFSGTAKQTVHIVGYSIWALRVRISSAITGGGTVTVTAWGSGS